jgi:hypothetical protein
MLQNQIHNNRSGVDEKHTKDNIWSFPGFLHYDMIDPSSSVVPPDNNRNGVDSMSKGGCSCRWLISARARVGASISKITFLSTGIALPFGLRWVLSSLGPLNILISSSRGLNMLVSCEFPRHLENRRKTRISNR